MGGTWDATNLVAGRRRGRSCPIGLDHPELGSTLAEIAGEKAGIIKAGQDRGGPRAAPEALAVIEARARRGRRDAAARGARLGAGGRVAGGRRPVAHGARTSTRRYEELSCRCSASYAARNARPRSSPSRRSLERRARRPTRCARRSRGADVAGPARGRRRRPLIVLDGAHNPAGARGARRRRCREVFAVGAAAPRDRGRRRTRTWTGIAGRARAARRRGVRGDERQRPRTADAEAVAEALAVAGRPDVDVRGRGRRAGRRAGAARPTATHPRDRARCTLSRTPAGRSACTDQRGSPVRSATDTWRTVRWPSNPPCLIVKPDGVRRGLVGEVLRRVEARASRSPSCGCSRSTRRRRGALRRASREAVLRRARRLHHRGTRRRRAGSAARTRSTCWRTLMGPTNPVEAPPGTIRGDFATMIAENIVHGSDSPESAARELKLFFG